MLLSLFERRPQANSRRYASLTCLVIQTMQKHANGRYLLAIQLQFTSYSFGHQWNGASFLIQRILPAYYFRNSYPQSYQHNPQEQRRSKGDGGFCFKKQLGGARAVSYTHLDVYKRQSGDYCARNHQIVGRDQNESYVRRRLF